VQRSRAQTRGLSQPNRMADVVYLRDSDVRRSHAFALMLDRVTGLDVREALPDFAPGNFEAAVCNVIGLHHLRDPVSRRPVSHSG
jgi:hypothetical protein